MKVTRIIIRGRSPEEVHGIGLRERFQKLVQKGKFVLPDGKTEIVFEIRGKIRNDKQQGVVELILQGDAEKNKAFLEVLEKFVIPGINKRLFDESSDTPHVTLVMNEEDREFDLKASYWKLEAQREDDATETVWALKGAGQVFADIANELQTFSERDKRKKDALLRALESELSSNLLILEPADASEREHSQYTRLSNIVCAAVLNNLEAYEQDELSLVDSITEMAHAVNTHNSYVDATIAGQTNQGAIAVVRLRTELPDRIRNLNEALKKRNMST